MLRPRTDLLAREDTGLVAELCGWSTATDGWGGDVTVSDFGRDTEVPRLQFHVFRAWDVLSAEDVAHAVDIQIDGRVHVTRIAAVMDAMLADPNASVDGLRHVLDIRKVDASDLDDIWTEAEVRLTDERAWGDLDWDELG